MYVEKKQKKDNEPYVPKNYILRIRITSELKDELEENAGVYGQSMADYVRAIIAQSSPDIRGVVKDNQILLNNLTKKIAELAINQMLIMQKLSIKMPKKPKFKYKKSPEDLPEVSDEEVKQVVETTPDSF